MVGNRSFAISLPKQWVLDNHLKKHDSVFVESTDTNELRVTAHERSRRVSGHVTVAVKHPELVPEFLTHCYITNVNSVTVVGKPISFETTGALHKTLENLEGFDITTESDERIEIKFLFGESTVTLPIIYHRMVYLIKMMVDALERMDLDATRRAEVATDRLYYLGMRLLFACQHDQDERKRNGIVREDDIPFLYTRVRKLENMADNTYRMQFREPEKADYTRVRACIVVVEKLLHGKTALATIKTELAALGQAAPKTPGQHVSNRVFEMATDVLETYLSISFNESSQEHRTI